MGADALTATCGANRIEPSGESAALESTAAAITAVDTVASSTPAAGFCVFLAAAATLATGQLFGFIALMPDLIDRFGANARLGLPLFARQSVEPDCSIIL